MKPVMEVNPAMRESDRQKLEADGWLVVVNPSIDASHVVHAATGAAPEMVPVTETDFPPPQVLAAMRRISPNRDRTFDANWAYWERNKEHAAKNPEAFALDILQGIEYDRPTADAAQSTE